MLLDLYSVPGVTLLYRVEYHLLKVEPALIDIWLRAEQAKAACTSELDQALPLASVLSF